MRVCPALILGVRIAAGGTLVMLPVIAFTVLVRKFLVHGLTAGGVKA
jgi:multiple sugar transport system permease protein